MANARSPKSKPSIQITYCVESGFVDMATSLAAAIKDKLGIAAKLKEGHGGIFEVAIDGKAVHRRCACRSFPTAEEVIERAEVLMKQG